MMFDIRVSLRERGSFGNCLLAIPKLGVNLNETLDEMLNIENNKRPHICSEITTLFHPRPSFHSQMQGAFHIIFFGIDLLIFNININMLTCNIMTF